MTRRITEPMYRTLACLPPSDGTLHSGYLSVAEVEQSGGTRACLRAAEDKGWVGKRVPGPNDQRDVNTYYITPEGMKARLNK